MADNDVICLCDSDEEVPTSASRPPPTTAGKTKRAPAEAGVKSASEVVELLDDDTDDEDNSDYQQQLQKKNPTIPASNNRTPRMKTLSNASLSSDIPASSSATRVVSQETRPFKRKRNIDQRQLTNTKLSYKSSATPKHNPDEPSSSQYSNLHKAPLPTSTSKIVNPYAKKKKPSPTVSAISKRPSHADAGSDSDDSDDSILDPHIGLKGAKNKKKKLPRSNSYAIAMSQESSARMSLSLSQESYSSTTTTASTGSRIITHHPYAKKKAPPRLSLCQTTSSVTTATRAQPPPKPTMAINPYAKKAAPPPSQTSTYVAQSRLQQKEKGDVVQYPTLLSNSRTYPDLRARFMLALWERARRMTYDSYEGPNFDRITKKILALALEEYPIRSVEELVFRFNHKSSTSTHSQNEKNETEDQLRQGGYPAKRITTPTNACSNGKYYSIVEACLVSILVETQRRWRLAGFPSRTIDNCNDEALTEMLKPKKMWISLKWLLGEIDRRLQPDCPAQICREEDEDNGAQFYALQSTRSAEYAQIKKLCGKARNTDIPYLKTHKVQKQIHFELTFMGYRQATKFQTRILPESSGHYRRSNLTTVEPKFNGICLGVDSREGGVANDRRILHQMCNRLDMTKIPYFVGLLCIGDYCFFHMDTSLLCPILVERKSVQDMAFSISQDRWQNQKQRMYAGQYVFGYDNCRIAYIIEGKEEKQQITGGYIGSRRYNVTRERFDEEIAKLETEGFDVLRTSSVENSMFVLSRWAQCVGEEVRDGKLRPEYTYEEFKRETMKIPKTTDFSRLARFAMEEKKRKQLPGTETTIPAAAAMSGYDSDIEVIELSSSSFDFSEKKRKPQEVEEEVVASSSRSVHTERTQKPQDEVGIERLKRKLWLAKVASLNKKNRNSEAVNSSWRTENLASIASRLEGNNDGKEVKIKLPSQVEDVQMQRKKYRRLEPKRPKTTTSVRMKTASSTKPVTQSSDNYSSWSIATLQEECIKYGLAKSGKLVDLINRLHGPKPPQVWVERKTKGEYVPRTHDSGGTALLVALLLLEEEEDKEQGRSSRNQQHPGFDKDTVYMKAEELCITKNPFSGGTTQTGPYHYDGWSSMKYLLNGDPPLVVKKRNKFRLTRSCGLSGYTLAKGLHRWCHDHGNCGCANL